MKLFRCITRLSAFVSFAALAISMSGCGNKCEGVYCAPCTGSTEDVILRFDLDSARGGFRKAEVSGGYVVRYALPGFTLPIDTTRQRRGETFFYSYAISLRSLAPYIPNNSTNYVAYNYRFVLPTVARAYDISGLEVKGGDTPGDGCCDCGTNLRRRFVLNGVPVVADGDSEITTILRR